MESYQVQALGKIIKDHMEVTNVTLAAIETVLNGSELAVNKIITAKSILNKSTHKVIAGAKRKKAIADPNAPKKPLSGYQMYLKDKSAELRAQNPEVDAKKVFTLVAEEWKKLSQSEKDVFNDRSSLLKEEYKSVLAQYNENKVVSDEEDGGDGGDEERKSKKSKKSKKKKRKH